MRSNKGTVSLALFWTAVTASAFAQEPSPYSDSAPPASVAPSSTPAVKAPPAPAPVADAPRRDPKGVKGISPFWEAIKRGDDALAARDLAGAKVAYQEAIKLDPHNGVGQYRIGEVELAEGHIKEAESVWDAALRFSGDNAALKAKILFVLADAKERRRSFEEEKNGWNAYETHVKASPTAKTFPASAADRKKRIDEWKQLETDYAAVKERIKLRLQEAEKSAAASAQSPQNK